MITRCGDDFALDTAHPCIHLARSLLAGGRGPRLEAIGQDCMQRNTTQCYSPDERILAAHVLGLFCFHACCTNAVSWMTLTERLSSLTFLFDSPCA